MQVVFCDSKPFGLTVVPVTGLEPVRENSHGILSPGRLPIPPHRRVDLFIVPQNHGFVNRFGESFMKRIVCVATEAI